MRTLRSLCSNLSSERNGAERASSPPKHSGRSGVIVLRQLQLSKNPLATMMRRLGVRQQRNSVKPGLRLPGQAVMTRPEAETLSETFPRQRGVLKLTFAGMELIGRITAMLSRFLSPLCVDKFPTRFPVKNWFSRLEKPPTSRLRLGTSCAPIARCNSTNSSGMHRKRCPPRFRQVFRIRVIEAAGRGCFGTTLCPRDLEA